MSRKRSSKTRKSARPARSLSRTARDRKEHDRRIERIKKWRGIGLFGGLVPLGGLTACDIGLAIACLPREIYLGIWAAVVGAVVGLSIRLVLERRRFQHHPPPG
ncbi:MAG TPA: hypothetical protein VIM50_03985 [Candidatus Limnocylindria bacterium]